MSGLFDLFFSYTMIGIGFALFGIVAHGWLFPERFGDSLTGLLAASFVLGLLGAILILIGLNWHRAATKTGSLPGPREL